MVDMHEGQRLQGALDDAGKRQADLADALGISAQAVSRYMKAKRFKAAAWETISGGLVKIGISPSRVRLSDESGSSLMDLRPHLVMFTNAQLPALLAILEADKPSREALVMLIKDRLERPRK